MSRRLAQHFNCQPLAELTGQLLVGPVEKRIEQIRRAERLHDLIDQDQNYPFDFINYSITGYHSESDDAILVGAAILGDLRLIIDSLSRSVPLPRNEEESIQTAQELAKRFNVSTKSILRWRKIGLRWRWVKDEGDERKQIVFTHDAISHFVKHHQARIDKASHFSQLNSQVRLQLIEHARQIASDSGLSLFQTARLLATRYDRSIETIRLLLERYDRNHPKNKVFSKHTGPLTSRQKKIIERAHRMGIAVDKIAAHFRRTKSTVHRTIRQRRASVLRSRHIDYIDSPIFKRDDADTVLLRHGSPNTSSMCPHKGITDALNALPAPIRGLYCRPGIEVHQQKSLFVRMNYLKFKAAALCRTLSRHTPKVADMNAIDQLLQQANKIRDHLIIANLGVILRIARQHVHEAPENMNQLTVLLELGNNILFESVTSFDTGKDQPYETHLTWHLRRCYARHEPTAGRATKREPPTVTAKHMQATARKMGINLGHKEPSKTTGL